MCILIFSTTIVSNIYHSTKNGAIYDKTSYIGLQCKAPIIIFWFQWLNFLDRFSMKTEISNFMKIRPVGAEIFHAERRTDMTKLIVAFRNFGNAPKIKPNARDRYEWAH